MMGHARAATVGSINEHNAHPIKEGPIIGCHNGTIWKWGPTKAEESISSDSRVLFRKMTEGSLQETLEDAGDLAAYALSWINLNTMTFNLLRNSKRPLFVMWSAAGSTMYWASERGMLCWMAERTQLAYKNPEVVPENTLIRFRLGNMTPIIQKLEIKPKHSVAYAYSAGCSNDWDYCQVCWHRKTVCQCEENKGVIRGLLESCKSAFGISDETTEEERISVDGEILEPLKVYIGFNRAVWSLKDLEAKTRDGCCNCLRDLDVVKDKIYWFSRTDPVCVDCLDFMIGLVGVNETITEGKFLN